MAAKEKSVLVPGEPDPRWATLAGKFFHAFDEEGCVNRQGRILNILPGDLLVIQYFEWITGSGSSIELTHLSSALDGKWKLYVNDEAMREGYDHFVKRRRA